MTKTVRGCLILLGALGAATLGCASANNRPNAPSDRSPAGAAMGTANAAPDSTVTVEAPPGAPPLPPTGPAPGASSAAPGSSSEPPPARLAPATTGRVQESSAASSPPGCAARVGPLAIKRSALVSTVNAGFGNWLRGVEVEPRVERGQFRGWLIRSVYEGDPCWSDVDLKSGDVVSRVNRRPIERPEQAHAVWSGLRQAKEIVVDYERAGRSKTLRFEIVDDL